MDSFRGGHSGPGWIEPRLAHRADPQGHRRGSGANPGSASARDGWETGQSSGADSAQSVAWTAIERALHAQTAPPFYSMASPAAENRALSARRGLVPSPRQISTRARAGDRLVIPGRRPVRLPLRRSGGDPPLRPFRRGALRRLAGNRRRALPGGGRPSLRAVRPGAGRGIDRPRRRARPGLQARFRASLPRAIGCRALGAVDGRGADLGSATPSVETFWRSRQGDVRLLALPERVGPELLATDGSRESTPWSCLGSTSSTCAWSCTVATRHC